MIFQKGRSALVRLTDSVKMGLEVCGEHSNRAIEAYEKYAEPLAQMRAAALAAERGEVTAAEAIASAKKIGAAIPIEAAQGAILLQGALHNQVLATIVMCCFAMEGYANTLAHFLLAEGLVTGTGKVAIEGLIGPNERNRVGEKWLALGGIAGKKFDTSRRPWQDFAILFKFRDAHAHSKVIEWSTDVSKTEFGNKLPDPVTGSLTLEHALFAAETYWAMVEELHALMNVDHAAFARHYALTPWLSDKRRKELREVAKRYAQLAGGKGSSA